MQVDKNNNPDVTRVNPWAPLSQDTKDYLEKIKLMANELNALYSPVGEIPKEQARLYALARTYLEIASMFAVKAATT
jgi:hypothetical protein